MLLFDWFRKLCIQRQRKYKHGATCSVGSHKVFNFNKEIKSEEPCVFIGVLLCLTALLNNLHRLVDVGRMVLLVFF